MTQLRDPDRRRALLISILLHLFVLLMIVWLYQRPEPVPLESFLVIDVGERALAEEETQAPAADAPAPQAAEALVEADQAGEPQEQAPEAAPPAQAEPVAEPGEAEPVEAAPPEEAPTEAAPPEAEPIAEPEPVPEPAPEPQAAEPAPPVEATPPAPQAPVTPEADAPETEVEATALPEIEDPLPTVPSAQALPVPTPDVSAEVVPTRTLAIEPTASVDPAQAVPMPEVQAEVDTPETVPIPQPQVEATVEELEPSPQAVPTPQAQASVSEAQAVPTPQAQATVQAAQNVPSPQASASVSTTRPVPTPQATASVDAAQSVPNPNASASVSAAQSVPSPNASASVSGARTVPSPQAAASVAGARTVPSPNASAAVAEARAIPNPNATAEIDADIVAAAAGEAADSNTNIDAPEGAVTAGQANNRTPGGNSERSGQTTAQEGASEDNLGLAAGPEGSENPTGAPIARVPYRENRDRPLTVMLDNVGGYPQYGLLEASMIVEMPVEGGQSRLMSVYDRIDPAQVGPIRSARDYFHTLSENMNGILVHVGGSPSALAAIEQSRLPSIDAMSSGEVFRREGGEAPYNTFSSGLDLRQTVNRLLLNNPRVVSGTTYRPEDDTADVSQIDIAYSGIYDTGFRFIENLNLYRWVRNGADASDALGEAVYVDAVVVANIIAQPIPGDTAGRLYIPLEASRATLYLRGKAIEGRWDPEGGVRFVTSLGEQIDLTPFKTWVVFTPETSEVVAQ